MAVRAVTPRVVAISGHLAFYRDADGVDQWKDEWATGEDPYDPEYLPPQRHGRPFLPLDELSPDRGLHTPGSGLAACEAALSGVPASSLSPSAGASKSSDEQSRPGGPRNGS